MANYSAQGARRLNNASFQQALSGYSPAHWWMFDENPDVGFAEWMKYLNPSFSDTNEMNRSFQRIYNNYLSRQFADPSGTKYPETSFMQYLSRLNPQKEVRRASPTLRGPETRRYVQPARWVAF